MHLVQLHREIGQYLTLAGIPDGRREAALLLAHVLDTDLVGIYSRQTTKVDDDRTAQIRRLAEKRAKREPLAYILGKAFFMDQEFVVGPGVLVPRPDSEVLVETALSFCEKLPAEQLDVLDACTGTGCIGISVGSRLLRQNRLASLCLTEIDQLAAEYAAQNLARYPLDGRANLVIADLFPAAAEQQWDMILANPPYIATAEIDPLMPEVSRHEPRLALDGGSDGLNFYRRLIAESVPKLKPGGILLFEHGFDQAEAVTHLFQSDSRYSLIPLTRDYAGQPRVSGGILREPELSPVTGGSHARTV